jgi:hypothetical protein
MKFDEILNENVEMLNEGALTDFLTATFKGFKRTVGSAAEASLTKALNDVAQGGKKVALSALRKNSSYQDALKTTVAEASRAQYGKTFDQLLQFDKNAAQKLVNDVQTGMEKELSERAALSKTIIDKDVKSATSAVGKTQKAVNAGRATQQDLVMATKELVANTKLQTKYADMQRVIAGMDKLSAKKVADILKGETKVIEGAGGKVADGVKGNTQIFSGGKFFTITKEQLAKFPGKVKRVIVNNPVKSTLIGAGLTAAALYYFFGGNSDGVILTDENGNDVPDFGGQWAKCIQELLASKEGTLVRGSNGEISVLVKPTEYPNGVQFYSNGRVLNVATKQMGSWSCKGATPIIAESEKISLTGLVNEQLDPEVANDVETMIDLLDFPVSQNDLISAGKLLKKYVNNGKGKKFLSDYQRSGLGGGDLNKTLNNIVTVNAASVQAKEYLTQLVGQIQSGKGGGQPKTGGKFGLSHINIKWDGEKKSGGGPSPVVKKKGVNYHDCSSKDFPFEFGCISPKIAEIQICIGVKPSKGYFGPKTVAALKNLEYIQKDVVITKEMYDKIKTLPGCTQANPDKPKTANDFAPKDVPSDALNPQMPTDGENPDTSTLKTPEPASPQETGENIYNRLQRQGFFRGRKIGENNRIPYKGGELPDADIEKLDQFFNQNGYTRFKPVEQGKRYGEKWVWRKA